MRDVPPLQHINIPHGKGSCLLILSFFTFSHPMTLSSRSIQASMSLLVRPRFPSVVGRRRAAWQVCGGGKEIHMSSIAFDGKKDDDGSVTYALKGRKATKPYNERQSTSGTIDEIKDKDTAFDPSTVDPKDEIERMKREDPNDESPIEWSGANEKTSPQNK